MNHFQGKTPRTIINTLKLKTNRQVIAPMLVLSHFVLFVQNFFQKLKVEICLMVLFIQNILPARISSIRKK